MATHNTTHNNTTHNTIKQMNNTFTEKLNTELDKAFRYGYETGKASVHNQGTPNDEIRAW
jgi:hypothetical protein